MFIFEDSQGESISLKFPPPEAAFIPWPVAPLPPPFRAGDMGSGSSGFHNTSLWPPFPILSFTFKYACNFIGCTLIIQDSFPSNSNAIDSNLPYTYLIHMSQELGRRPFILLPTPVCQKQSIQQVLDVHNLDLRRFGGSWFQLFGSDSEGSGHIIICRFTSVLLCQSQCLTSEWAWPAS